MSANTSWFCETARPESVSAQHFFKVVQLHVGGEYYTVAKTQLWEMRLIVLAKVSLRPQVHTLWKLGCHAHVVHLNVLAFMVRCTMFTRPGRPLER